MSLTSSKNHPENSPEGKQSRADAVASDPTVAEVQKIADAENEKGFRGIEVDSTPNENYSVQGVTSGAPTPETDKEHAKKVREDVLGVESKA